MTKRQSRNDWLDHGLEILAAQGAEALKADPLAKSLGVSRGSFYWHFKDLKQYHDLLLERFQERTTEETIQELDRSEAPADRLKLLLQRAMSQKGRLERAVRSWATWHPDAAAAVARVDGIRLAYLTMLLQTAGVPDHRARARAAFIYWAYIGRVMTATAKDDPLPEAEITALTRLLQM